MHNVAFGEDASMQDVSFIHRFSRIKVLCEFTSCRSSRQIMTSTVVDDSPTAVNPTLPPNVECVKWEKSFVPGNWVHGKDRVPPSEEWSQLGSFQRDRFLANRHFTIQLPSDFGGVWPLTLVNSLCDETSGYFYYQYVRQRDPELMGCLVRAVPPNTIVPCVV